MRKVPWMNGELSFGRKAEACDTVFASRCQIRGSTSFLVAIFLGGVFLFRKFFKSAKNLADTRVLCSSAILISVYFALYAVKLPIALDLRITFTFIPLALAGWLFGAVPAMLVGIISDVVSSLLLPQGPYFPGFTLTAALSGLVYGLLLYEQEYFTWRVFLSKIVVNLLFNTLLNSFWLSILYSKGYIVYLMEHLIKNIIALPIEAVLLIIIMKILTERGLKKMYK